MAQIRLPEEGRPQAAVLEEMKTFATGDADYRTGRTWSLVYYLGEEHTEFLRRAHGLYFSENGLNPMAFASLKRFETDVVGMTASLLHAGPEAGGVLTSGGTESCLLAVKTWRDRARRLRGVRRPEMILPQSGHVAFLKAAEYFGVKAVRVPVTDDWRADVRAVRRRINRNTALIVASAPGYPHGIIDPIEELGALAARKRIPLHVDGCLGGFLLPFVERLGHPLPPFDFRVPGVCSMSADVHKYGYAAKGASVLVYRDSESLRDQIFVSDDWPGGIFASPGLLGTRPGGSIAAAWAAMQSLGEAGYLAHARTVMATARRLQDGVNAVDGLEVLGQPPAGVFAWRSNRADLNIFAVADQLEERGWHVDRQHRPDCLHTMVTPSHAAVTEEFLADLRAAVEQVRGRPDLALSGRAATYGMISAIPLRGLVRENVLRMMLDLYGPGGRPPDLDAGAQTDWAARAGLLFLKVREEARRRWRQARERA